MCGELCASTPEPISIYDGDLPFTFVGASSDLQECECGGRIYAAHMAHYYSDPNFLERRS